MSQVNEGFLMRVRGIMTGIMSGMSPRVGMTLTAVVLFVAGPWLARVASADGTGTVGSVGNVIDVAKWWQGKVTGTMNANTCWLYLYTTNRVDPVYLDDLYMCVGSQPESGPNLIANYGFENGTNGWDFAGDFSLSSLPVATPTRHGAYALKLQAAVPVVSGGSGSSVKQNVMGLSNGTLHTLSFWYLATNAVDFVVRYSGHSHMTAGKSVNSDGTVYYGSVIDVTRPNNDTMRLTWATRTGKVYQIMNRLNLQSGTWQSVSSITAATFSASLDIPLGRQEGFYQLVETTTTNTSSTVPASPTNLVVTANSDTQVILTWNAGDGGATGFDILRSVNGGAYTLLASVGNVSSYQDTGLAPGTSYSYQVRATNSAGQSPYTAASPLTQTWSGPMSVETFESGLPSYITATRQGSLSTSPLHYKQGSNSLRWDWLPGEEMIMRHGIGDITRVGGYLSSASFVMWLYSETTNTGTLTFEFRAGTTVTASFVFPLGFTGWRQALLCFDEFPSGTPTANVDNIRVVPSDGTGGSVFLDAVYFNTLSRAGFPVDPAVVASQLSVIPSYQEFPKPTSLTPAEEAGLVTLGAPAPPGVGSGIPESNVTALITQFDALGIVRDANGIRGPGYNGRGNYQAAPGEFGESGISHWPDELGPNALIATPTTAQTLALDIGNAYRSSNDDDQRTRLAESFLLIADHLKDQEQSLTSSSFTAMRDVLSESGRLDIHVEPIIRALPGGSSFFVTTNEPVISHMDFYETYIPRLLDACFLQVDPLEQVRWLNCWKANLERSMVQPTSAYKIDGSAYHHNGHYFSYAQGSFYNFITLWIPKVSNTPWKISAEPLERLRRCVLAQKYYTNFRDTPLSLRGRSPFELGRIEDYGVGTLNTFARQGELDGSDSVDHEVGAMYLRFSPGSASDPTYASRNITPEPDPNGSYSMPYAGLLTHRRSDWMVAVKGQSTYVWGSERESDRNKYGLFMGCGALEVLAGGTPVDLAGSGCRQEGWDWGRFEGTTVPHLPLAELDAGWGELDGVTRSPETFVGGLSHKGSHGTFGMILNETIQPGDKILRGKKSWFFMEDKVLCLGSGITCDITDHPTETILCQKSLRASDQESIPPTMVDGTDMTAFGITQVFSSAQSHWFLDVQQTGFYVPAGQNLTISRKRQYSKDLNDALDTQGDFLAGWLDHGNAPAGASYEYLLVVRANASTMAAIASSPPYQVLQRDDNAHIVWDTVGRRWSAVVWTAGSVAAHAVGADTLPLKAVDRPCMVMADAPTASSLDISVADPDMNWVDEVSQQRSLRVTVRGAWQISTATGRVNAWLLPDVDQKVRIISSNATETVIEIDCQHGASYDISLIP